MLESFGVRALRCYERPVHETLAIKLAEFLQDVVDGPIEVLCHENHIPGQTALRQHNVGNVTIEIRYEVGHGVEDCTSAFDTIIEQCLVRKGRCGGEKKLNGFVYEMHGVNRDRNNHGHHNIKERGISGDSDEKTFVEGGFFELNVKESAPVQDRSREDNGISDVDDHEEFSGHRKELGKRAKKKPKLGVTNPTKPTFSKAKPSTKAETTSATRPPPTSKSSPKKSSVSQSPKASSSPNPTPKAQPRQTCQQIQAIADKSRKEAKRGLEDDLVGSNGFIGGITQRGMSKLVNRSPKDGLSCEVSFNANHYPDKKAKVMVRWIFIPVGTY